MGESGDIKGSYRHSVVRGIVTIPFPAASTSLWASHCKWLFGISCVILHRRSGPYCTRCQKVINEAFISEPSVGEAGCKPDATKPVTTSPRFHQLDGLRALAVTLVLIHHSLTSPIAGYLAAHGHLYARNLLSLTT